jgi:hypothetical protein
MFKFHFSSNSRVRLACYDGEGEDAAAAAKAAAAAAAVAAGAPDPNAETKFSQIDVNKFVAEERRKAEAKHQAQLSTIQKTLEETLTSKNLTAQEREQLAQRLEDVQKESRTKDQQQAHERKQLEEQYAIKLTDEKTRADRWETRYRESMVDRALQDAAVNGEAFKVSQMVTQLRPWTRITEITDEKTGKGTGHFKVVVDFPDIDPATGQSVVTLHTPESAVKRMKELPNDYGNLFKSGVVGGIGSNTATGGPMSGPGGKIDVKNLSPQQYQEIRAKNPELLGLRRDKRRAL